MKLYEVISSFGNITLFAVAADNIEKATDNANNILMEMNYSHNRIYLKLIKSSSTLGRRLSKTGIKI